VAVPVEPLLQRGDQRVAPGFDLVLNVEDLLPLSPLLPVDTDMLILLLASGMLERVAEALGYSPNQLRRLPAGQTGRRRRTGHPAGRGADRGETGRIKPLKPISSVFAPFLGENVRAIATTQGRSRSPGALGISIKRGYPSGYQRAGR